MRSRRKEKVNKEDKTREILHPTMDDDTDGDPHWRIFLFYLGRLCSKAPTDAWHYAKAPFSHVIQNACVMNLICDKTLLSMGIFNCVWQVICLLLFYPSLPDPLFSPLLILDLFHHLFYKVQFESKILWNIKLYL